MSVAEWIRHTLLTAMEDQARTVDAKLKAIAEASSHQFPTADIDLMLCEIETGQRPTQSPPTQTSTSSL